MSNIDMQNSKETWRQIGKLFNLGKRKTHGAETVSTEQFYKYFKQQNATPPNNILDLGTNREAHSNERLEGQLDYPITEGDHDLEAAVNKRNASKSPGIDNILS